MDLSRFSKTFPLGSHLCREPMPPMSELKRDMENLKAHGFNLIKLQESWKTDEPQEGVFDFSVSQELIEHAAKLDLGVYFGLSMEHAPAWVWQKHPGARMIGRDGTPILYEAQLTIPADGKPGPCFDDPGAMEAHLRFIRELVRTLGRYENIVVWNTWQEMGYEAERLTGHKACYCPNTIRAFQDWLQEEYGSLEALNYAWKSRYTCWQDVVPNRDRGRFCLCNSIAYEYFLNDVRIPRIMKRRAEVIREADPLHRPVFAHQGSSTVGSGVDWRNAESQDFLGCSCYPAWFHLHDWDDASVNRNPEHFRQEALLNEIWESVALKFDYLRGCNPLGNPLWGAEFQGGPICTGLYKGRVPSGSDLRRWMLTAVGSGANGISFWVTRAEIQGQEINGYSLLDSVGDTTERYEEAARVGCALNQHAALFAPGNIARSPVAILVNERNFNVCGQLMGGGDEHLMYSTRGWHRLLWEAGIPVDFVEISQLDDLIQDYRLMVLPFPLSISEEAAETLTNFVQKGGHLVSEACPGRFDSCGYGNRGELSPTLRALFGADHEALVMMAEPHGGQRWKMHELSWGDYHPSRSMTGCGALEGISIAPNLYLESFTCTTGVPLMHCGDAVCAVSHQTGKGEAWLLGSFLGHSGTAYRGEGPQELVRRLLSQCGISPEHDGTLLLRRLTNGKDQALLFTNPADQTVTENVPIPAGCRAQTLFGTPLTVQNGMVEITVEPLDVSCILIESL